MSFKIIVTPTFESDSKSLLKKYISLKSDLALLVESLEKEPFQGISLGKDCYKIRLAIKSKRKGKSGGARIITCVKIVHEKVYLLTIYDKSEKDDIREKELNELLKLI
jgi:mRNA-degrading endonuclease RelE of RelBE toxin-antitoxin system